MDLAMAAEDDDLSSVDIGAIFLDALPMLEAFQAYCTKQVGPNHFRKYSTYLHYTVVEKAPLLSFYMSSLFMNGVI